MKDKQHVVPCNECPFRRQSLKGWLGENNPVNFVVCAQIETPVQCHKKWSMQCAGRATMWANSAKVPRDPKLLRVEPNRTTVFSNIMEFMKHHGVSADSVRTAMWGESNA
jgi:hypothetical protein